MKIISILLSLSAIAFVFTLNSCKKKGCTDELAINYFSDNKEDDGSCSYSSTRLEGRFAYSWNDTLVDTADVYSFEPSYMGVYSADGFDHGLTEFKFLVNWAEKSLAMPDSLLLNLPDTAKSITGVVTDRDKFVVTFTQRIDTWNNPGTWKDTVYTYNFDRI